MISIQFSKLTRTLGTTNMSNPAVSILATAHGDYFKRFVVEDNIGEAIHIHADGLRLDLTINQLFQLREDILTSLRALFLRKGLDIDYLDESFFLNCSHLWPYLDRAEVKKVKLSDLRVSVYYPRLMPLHRVLPISKAPAFRYLQGDQDAYISYAAASKFALGSPSRLQILFDSIVRDGFDGDRRPIVIFNGQTKIMDGQHRACCLFHMEPNQEVTVLDIHFKTRIGLPRSLTSIHASVAKKLLYCLRYYLIHSISRLRLFLKNFF